MFSPQTKREKGTELLKKTAQVPPAWVNKDVFNSRRVWLNRYRVWGAVVKGAFLNCTSWLWFSIFHGDWSTFTGECSNESKSCFVNLGFRIVLYDLKTLTKHQWKVFETWLLKNTRVLHMSINTMFMCLHSNYFVAVPWARVNKWSVFTYIWMNGMQWTRQVIHTDMVYFSFISSDTDTEYTWNFTRVAAACWNFYLFDRVIQMLWDFIGKITGMLNLPSLFEMSCICVAFSIFAECL